MEAILGRKLGMTQVFAANGEARGVTVIEAGPCVVIQVKTRHGWKRFAKVKLSRKSTFKLLRTLAGHKKYRFRATTAADSKHLAGVSRVVTIKT